MTSLTLTQAEVQRILDADGEYLPADLKAKLETAIPLTQPQLRNLVNQLHQGLDVFVKRAPADVWGSTRLSEAVETTLTFLEDLRCSLDPSRNDD